MPWFKAFHIIAMVAWFAGLFYLPRLFVYHVEATDPLSNARFKIMEHKLYYYIMLPAALATLFFGILLLHAGPYSYWHANWMHAKLILVGLLFVFHHACGKWLKAFKADRNTHSGFFYRCWNEFPTLILIGTVLLVELRPF